MLQTTSSARNVIDEFVTETSSTSVTALTRETILKRNYAHVHAFLHKIIHVIAAASRHRKIMANLAYTC